MDSKVIGFCWDFVVLYCGFQMCGKANFINMLVRMLLFVKELGGEMSLGVAMMNYSTVALEISCNDSMSF